MKKKGKMERKMRKNVSSKRMRRSRERMRKERW
jgi:hypothetical protein